MAPRRVRVAAQLPEARTAALKKPATLVQPHVIEFVSSVLLRCQGTGGWCNSARAV